MLKFNQFIKEAWVTEKPDKRSEEVSGSKTYDDASKFRSNSHKIGEVGGLHVYASHNPGGGMTHYTWNPKDKKIHHVLTNTETTKEHDGSLRLKYLTAHARRNSHVKMSDVYHHLVTRHNRVLVGTSHSHGAVKLWNRLRSHPELHVHGENPDGSHVELKHEDKTHAPTTTKDPEERKIGKMALVLRKKAES